MKKSKTFKNIKIAVKLLCHIIFLLLVTIPVFSQNSDFNDPPYWRQAIGGAVIGSPASQAESVVMVSDGGNVKAFGWQGKPLWDYFARGRLQPFITRSREGTTYVCRSSNSGTGILIAINRAGRELWQINLSEPLISPVLVGWDGRLFVFTANRIRCLTASGYQLWSKNPGMAIAIKPQYDGHGGFFLVLEDGEFQNYDAFGNTDSETLAEIPINITPLDGAGAEKTFLLTYSTGTAEIYSCGADQLKADQLMPDQIKTDSAKSNRIKLDGITFPGRPVNVTTRGNSAAYLLADGRVCLLSLNDKKILWTADTHLGAADLAGPDFESTFFYDERGIYLLTKSGASAFTDDGRRLWLIRLRGAASLPCFSDEGILYSGGTDWILYAYKLEERVKVQKHLLYGPAPEGNYGTAITQPGFWSDYPNIYNENEMNAWFREIETAIRQGQIGENEKEYVSWLMEIAGSTLGIYNPGNRPPVLVPPRARAARLLAYMGSAETIPFLSGLFARDRDPVVRAAAAEALGRIGVDPEGLAMNAFSEAVFPPAPLRDEQVLTAIAAASGALCRFSGPPLSETGIRILTSLSAADRPPAVRNRAEREIISLRY
ncbi:MAG: HEAT repeat domain-containing protein [Treponema sp.]|nr:HEAT repeat domain-containing protein [Treponema sp.]